MIPSFLKFRIPNKGCFDGKSVHEFQRQLLSKEVVRAKNDLKNRNTSLDEKRDKLKRIAPTKCLPSVVLHTRNERSENRQTQRRTHYKKLSDLSEKQEWPLFNVENTVITCGLTAIPPAYVLETLSVSPKNAILDRFDPKDILAELNGLLYHCRKKNIPDEIITDINVKTLTYIKKCRKMRNSKNIMQTKKYLKDHDLLAIPFDKGIGTLSHEEECLS